MHESQATFCLQEEGINSLKNHLEKLKNGDSKKLCKKNDLKN